MSIPLNPLNIVKTVPSVIQAGLVPFIQGDPGTSKSDCIRQIAKKYKLKLIDIRLSLEDPTSLIGFPTIKNERMGYAPPVHFPLQELDKVPKGYNGWILFLDEFNSAPLSVQAAAYRLVLDRQVGAYNLHKNVAIVCAGNLETNKAVTNQLSTAMQSRLIHLEMIMDLKSWLDWANKNIVDQRVISFLKARPELLHKFDPNHNDKTFPCARTWTFLSDYIKPVKSFSSNDLAVMNGTVSEGPALEFKAYCEVYINMPTIKEIEADPENVKFENKPDLIYALTTLISHNANHANIENLMKFVKRIPIDFQIVVIRDIYSKSPDLKTSDPLIEWVDTNSEVLF